MEKTRMKVTVKGREQFKGDLLVYCLVQPKKGIPLCDKSLKAIVQKAYKLGDFNAKEKEKLFFYPDGKSGEKTLAAKRVLVIGLGELKKETALYELKELIRKVGGEIALEAKKCKAETIMISLPKLNGLTRSQIAQTVTEGVMLGDYRFDKYKKKENDNNDFEGIGEIKIFTKSSPVAVRRGVKRGQQAAIAACKARDMANEPGNGWTPTAFAKYGRRIAKKYGMKCTVLNKADMIHLGMGGMIGVNQGSTEPPKMVILEYEPPRKTSQTLLFVGKGLTFDSGGLSIKPSAGMEEMKYDMCGGAAVLSVMQVIGEEKPNVRVIAIVPATDNMVSGSALKPGDIIHHFNGISSEVINTDAEGRLILADALAYGVKKYKPDCVIDLATLTGAVIIGLGHHHTGLLSNNDKLVKRLVTAGEESGEPLWQLPLTEEYKKQLKSDVADVKNVGGRPGGTITAAAYLEKFVDKTPWAHLDIAGTAWNFTKKSYIPKGPSGTGVRTLLELVRNWKRAPLT